MRTIATILFLFSVTACTKDKSQDRFPYDCSDVEVSYANDIDPIVRASCTTGAGPGTGCHDAWILEYKNLKSKVESGQIRNVVYEFRSMPPDSNFMGIPPLTEEEIETVMCWIRNDSPNN